MKVVSAKVELMYKPRTVELSEEQFYIFTNQQKAFKTRLVEMQKRIAEGLISEDDPSLISYKNALCSLKEASSIEEYNNINWPTPPWEQ